MTLFHVEPQLLSTVMLRLMVAERFNKFAVSHGMIGITTGYVD
jgi:hypothetical protein